MAPRYQRDEDEDEMDDFIVQDDEDDAHDYEEDEEGNIISRKTARERYADDNDDEEDDDDVSLRHQSESPYDSLLMYSRTKKVMMTVSNSRMMKTRRTTKKVRITVLL